MKPKSKKLYTGQEALKFIGQDILYHTDQYRLTEPDRLVLIERLCNEIKKCKRKHDLEFYVRMAAWLASGAR